jgi:hypothetical protein
MRYSRIAFLLLASMITMNSLYADKVGLPKDVRYYPLAVGNVWTYQVHAFSPKAKDSTVKWTVTHASIEDGRMVYQIWPKPMQTDDEAMELAVTPQGILEVSDNTYILKFPITKGARWSQTLPGSKDAHSFQVRSARAPCQAGVLHIPDCVVVEETDDRLGLTTVTTYGRDIGPVLYEYRKKHSGKEIVVQTVTLVDHNLR